APARLCRWRRLPRRRCERSRCSPAARVRSSDDVGNQARAQALDLVLEQELTFLQPLQLQLILARIGTEPPNHVIQVVVLDLESVQALANLRLLLFGQRKVRHLWKRSCPMAASYPYTRNAKTPCHARQLLRRYGLDPDHGCRGRRHRSGPPLPQALRKRRPPAA